ncbi:MAG: response regulator [Acidimicrobiales bacterium]|nr:response regulator [Acidimicrobiales bacterium]
MTGAPLPRDEDERLAELASFGILDTAAEAAYDEIVELAAELCGTSMAALSLVDADRQWWKARVGLDATGTPREIAFCSHAILGDDVFVVPDATSDPRFADNPLVVGDPGIEFYAGAPLMTQHGHRVGTLCVLDTEARVLDQPKRRALEVLAKAAVARMEQDRDLKAMAALAVDARRSQVELADSTKLLRALSEVQSSFLLSGDPVTAFDQVLVTVLEVTGSEYGFIGEIRHDDDGAPYLKTHAITDISWDEATRRFYEENVEAGLEFHNLDTLFGACLRTLEPVMANEPAADPRAGGLPPGHLPLRAFLGVPFRTGAVVTGMIGVANRDGGYDPALVEWLEPILDTCGSLLGHYKAEVLRLAAEAALRDSETRLQERGRALTAANAELSRAARLKDEFLAAMSHELRTPLNAVIGMGEALNAGAFGDLAPDQSEAIAIIEDSGRHLLELISDILDLSKYEAGHLELQVDEVDLDSLFTRALRLVRETAHRKGVALRADIEDGLGPLWADPLRLRQILVNLLDNAVKFTPAGGSVTLDVAGEHGGSAIRFSVADTGIGIGIGPDDLERVFEPFIQVDSSLSRQHAGTGLGLALVQRLTDLHGGSVECRSTPGSGSTFVVRIPQGLPGPATTAAEDPVRRDRPEHPDHADRPLALVADDHEVNLTILTRYLEANGWRVVTARDGHDALERLRAEPPDVVLMDIQMPNMNGLTAIRAIRADPEIAETPVIAVTALAMPGDRERCIDAGADDYLAKPVHLGALLVAVERIIEGRSVRPPAPPT